MDDSDKVRRQQTRYNLPLPKQIQSLKLDTWGHVIRQVIIWILDTPGSFGMLRSRGCYLLFHLSVFFVEKQQI